MVETLRRPPGWHAQAACSGHSDPEIWFADDPAGVAAAKAVCAVCPVTDRCLADAVGRGDAFAIAGGLTARERHALAGVARPSPLGAWQHGTNAGYAAHGCRCDGCRRAHSVYVAGWRQRRRWVATGGLSVVVHELRVPAGAGRRRAFPGQLYIGLEAA